MIQMIGITDFAKVFHWSLVRVTSSRFQAIDYVNVNKKIANGLQWCINWLFLCI